MSSPLSITFGSNDSPKGFSSAPTAAGSRRQVSRAVNGQARMAGTPGREGATCSVLLPPAPVDRVGFGVYRKSPAADVLGGGRLAPGTPVADLLRVARPGVAAATLIDISFQTPEVFP